MTKLEEGFGLRYTTVGLGSRMKYLYALFRPGGGILPEVTLNPKS